MEAAPGDATLRRGWLICLGLVAGFMVLRLPYALWPLMLHPDERYYTFGGAWMLASGDFVVPRTLGGELRLRKPPLPYWYAAAGFSLFGQTALGAKALWLASAGAVLGLTFTLARVLGSSLAGAALAVAALAGHSVFAKAATQHLPDMPLVLGTTVALTAFAALLARPGARPAWLFYAGYGGLAFAILAKGLLPVLFLAVLILTRLIHRPIFAPEERRHERIAALIAAAACLWWFALMALRFPQELVAEFIGDQVAQKASFDPLAVLAHLRKALTDLLLPLAPALLVLFVARPRPDIRTQGAPALTLCLVWIAAVVALFAFANPLYERYTLPAVPAAAAVIGVWASRIDPAILANRLSRIVPALAVIPVIVALAGAVLLLRLGHWAAVGALVAGAGIVGVLARGVARRGAAVPAAALLGAIYPLVALAAVPLHLAVVQPTPAQTLARRLADEGLGPGDVTILATPRLANPLGLATGEIARLGYAPTRASLPPGAPLVATTDARLAPAMERSGYLVEVLYGFPAEEVPLPPLLAAWRTGDLTAFRKAHGPALVIARLP